MATFKKADEIDIPQSVGYYTDGDPDVSEVLQVFQPHQGRDLIYKNPNFHDGITDISASLDNRIPLGTYTLNNRDYWENNNFNESTFQSYLKDDLETIESFSVPTPDGDVVVMDEDDWSIDTVWSIDALPFVINPNNDEIIHLDRYYDKEIDKENYELATDGKINYYLGLRSSGRTEQGNIDIFSLRNERTKTNSTTGFGPNFFDYFIDPETDRGFYLFKLNWGDGSEIEHTDKPQLLERTTLFEHFYDKPGFYSITGLIYQKTTYHGIKQYEKFQTNILLNPSQNYELNLYDYSNFASIGGVGKDSAFVKSLYNMVGINPLTQDNSRASEEVIEKLNTLDKIQLLNVLGKVDYERIQPYWNFLSPYQTPTDNQDSYVFGCPVEWANNYYFLDNPPLPEGTQLIDDGTCFYLWTITIQLRVVDGLNGNIIDNATVPYSDELTQDVPSHLFPKFQIDSLLINESTDSTLRSWGDDLQEQIQDNNEFVVLLSGQGSMHTFSAPELWGMGAGDNEAEREISTLHVDWYFDGWYEDGVKIGSGTLSNHQFNTATTIEARFYYQDTIEPFPVQNVNVYNAAEPFTIELEHGGGEINIYGMVFDDPPFDITLNFPQVLTSDGTGHNAIVMLFDIPTETTGPLYGDLSHFEIRKTYWDHVNEWDVTEELPNQPYTDATQVTLLVSDKNLPYREYTYSIRSVDDNGLTSDYVYSNPIYPTPTDLIPNVITFPDNIDHMEYIEFATLRLNWNSVSIYDVGFEGDGFGYYRVRLINNNETVLVDENITDINTSQYVYNYIGELEGYDAANPAFTPMLPPDEYTFSIAVSDGNDNSSGFVTKNVTVEEWEDPDIPTLEQPEHIPIDLDNMWFGTEGDTMPTAPNSLQSVDVEHLDVPWNFTVRFIHDSFNLPDPFTSPWSWAVYAVWYNTVDEVWDDIMLGYQEYENTIVNDNLRSRNDGWDPESDGHHTMTAGNTREDNETSNYDLIEWEWGLNYVRNSTQPTEDIFYFIEVNDAATGQMIRSTLGRIVNLFEEVPDSPDPQDPDPVYGCTDPDALNYNSDAEEDNGSCQYNFTVQVNPGGPHGYNEQINHSVTELGANFSYTAPYSVVHQYGNHGQFHDDLTFRNFVLPIELIEGEDYVISNRTITLLSVESNLTIGVAYIISGTPP